MASGLRLERRVCSMLTSGSGLGASVPDIAQSVLLNIARDVHIQEVVVISRHTSAIMATGGTLATGLVPTCQESNPVRSMDLNPKAIIGLCLLA